MKKYKCCDCGKIWEAAEEPFECPDCHSANIVEVISGGKLTLTLKKYWWIIAVAIVLAVVLFLLSPSKGSTNVTTKQDKKYHTLTVELSGDYTSQYALVLKQDGVIMHQHILNDGNAEHTFTDLCGTYTLDVTWLGKGDAPQTNNYNNEFDFGDWCNETLIDDVNILKLRPEIKEIKSTPRRIIKKGDTYTVQVILHPGGVDDVEYAVDNGQWQNNNTFRNLKPGKHTYYVRNANQHAYIDSIQRPLEEATKGDITTEKLNGLLNQLSNGDDNAKREILKYFSGSTQVQGAENIGTIQELITDIIVNESSYTVIEIAKDGNQIKVRKK